MSRACVIGSGPNGLAAAIVLAQAGLSVDVFEAEAEPGGAVRTLPLTLPGFMHDFGSAVYPFAAGSPFFAALPLADYGLEWIHGEAPLAHPLDDGSAVVLERDLEHAERALGADGKLWRSLMQPAADDWMDFAEDTLGSAAAHSASSAAHGAIWTFGDSIRARFCKEPLCQPAHAGHLRGTGRPLISEFRPAAERDHRMDVRHHAFTRWAGRFRAAARRPLTQALIGYLESLGGSSAHIPPCRCCVVP